MENASKALLIAGAVLIGILVASLGVFLSEKMSDFTSRAYNDLQEHKRTEFNQQFLKYNKRDDLIIQDIVTIINLAKDSNIKNDLEEYDELDSKGFANKDEILNDSSFYVKVEFDNPSISLGGLIPGAHICKSLEKLTKENINMLINNEMEKNNLDTFSCEVYLNNKTNYVKYIRIH